MRKLVSYNSHYSLDLAYYFQLTVSTWLFSTTSIVASGIGRTTTFLSPKFSSTGTDRNLWIYNKPGLAPSARIYTVHYLCKSIA